MNFLSEEGQMLGSFFQRIKTRNFSGNAGLAIKNSIYQTLTSVVVKVGSLIFTIILARLLLPELFGLYALTLSTILIFVAFSNLGLSETITRFVSKELGKRKNSKAKSFFKYLIKVKILSTFAVVLVLIISAKFIANNYYGKPIYLALLAGGLYIIFVGFVSTIQSYLQAYNLFRPIFYRELIFQVMRVVLVPLVVILFLKNTAGQEAILFIIILILAFTYLFSGLSLFLIKEKAIYRLSEKKSGLSSGDKKGVNHFLLFTSATIFSGIFFGYIDVIMLGHFVKSQFIGYYQAAFSFVGAIAVLVPFSTALMPILSRMNKKNREYFFGRSVRLTFLFSLLASILLFAFSNILINFIFGSEYNSSVNILRIFSLVLFSMPIISMYTVYFYSKGKPEVVTKSLVYSTLLNIILNFVLISTMIHYGEIYAVYGATIATVISRWFYMFFLIFAKR